MISVTAGEYVLLPAGQAGWLPVLTLADWQNMTTMPPRLLQTILLAITQGENGVVLGGGLQNLYDSMLVKQLVAILDGGILLLTESVTIPAPSNDTDRAMYVSVFARNVESTSQDERQFRADDTGASVPKDSMISVDVRRHFTIEISRVVSSSQPITSRYGYLCLGWGKVFPGEQRFAEHLSLADTPLTVAQHAAGFDHSAASVAVVSLSSKLAGPGYSPGAPDLSMGEMAIELRAGKGDLPDLNSRISGIVTEDGEMETRNLRTYLDTEIYRRHYAPDPSASDPHESDQPAPFVPAPENGDKLAVNPAAISKAAGGLTKLEAIQGHAEGSMYGSFEPGYFPTEWTAAQYRETIHPVVSLRSFETDGSIFHIGHFRCIQTAHNRVYAFFRGVKTRSSDEAMYQNPPDINDQRAEYNYLALRITQVVT